MYRIAICDDEPDEMSKTKELLNVYQKAHPNCAFLVYEFASVIRLKDEIEAQAAFDLLLLDIYMPEKNGIDGARELRECGFDGTIIFLTTSLEHGIDAFHVDATQYFVKPVEKERFFAVLDRTFERMDEERRRFITLRTEKKMRRIALRDIVYCEMQKHYIHVNLTNGETLPVRMTLTEFWEITNEFSNFVRVGSTYVVNLGFVDSLMSKSMLLTTGKSIWLPRGSYAPLKERYFEFYREG